MKQYSQPYTTPYLADLARHGIRLPAVLCRIRTDGGREAMRRGIDVFRGKFLTPRPDGVCNTITSVNKDNLIITETEKEMKTIHYEHPDKEQLLEYFSDRIRIRKMCEDEAGRLMGLTESDIGKINAWPFPTLAEREKAIAEADAKELRRIKRESISKTAKYKMYGNSIVVDVLYHIFYQLFIAEPPKPLRRSLFDL
jgi:hypothetical protein